MVKEKINRTFDGTTWKTGNALVITIPASVIKRFRIKEKEILEVTIKR